MTEGFLISPWKKWCTGLGTTPLAGVGVASQFQFEPQRVNALLTLQRHVSATCNYACLGCFGGFFFSHCFQRHGWRLLVKEDCNILTTTPLPALYCMTFPAALLFRPSLHHFSGYRDSVFTVWLVFWCMNCGYSASYGIKNLPSFRKRVYWGTWNYIYIVPQCLRGKKWVAASGYWFLVQNIVEL